MSEPTDPLQAIAKEIVASLADQAWNEAWMRFEIVDDGVADSAHRFRPSAGAPEKDFVLRNPLAVWKQVKQVLAHAAERSTQRPTGILMKLWSDGRFDLTYLYPPSPAS